MPKIKNKEVRFRILNECLRDSHRLYEYETLLAELNRQLRAKDLPTVKERTLRYDLDDMQEEFGVKLDAKLMNQSPVVLRYANLSDSIYKLSPDESNSLRTTVDLLLNLPEPRPLQFDYLRVCLQKIIKDNVLELDHPSAQFADNLEHKGRKYFVDLCQYIMDKKVVQIQYKPYNKESYVATVHPYLLKQYNERWFLIGREVGYDGLRNLALDRMEGVKAALRVFKECDVDLKVYFDDIVGVTKVQKNAVETVKLKVASSRYPYFETKPLSSNQHHVDAESTDEYEVITIPLRDNNELMSQLLSYGEDLEVLEPVDLRKKIAEKVQKMTEKYK